MKARFRIHWGFLPEYKKLENSMWFGHWFEPLNELAKGIIPICSQYVEHIDYPNPKTHKPDHELISNGRV